MNYKQKRLQAHKNPFGLALRLVNYIALGYALWMHNSVLIVVLIGLDILNWLFMPAVHPKHELPFVNTIIHREMIWIQSPWTTIKILSLIFGITLFVVLIVGLWRHNTLLLGVAFLLIVILKQLILKMTKLY